MRNYMAVMALVLLSVGPAIASDFHNAPNAVMQGLSGVRVEVERVNSDLSDDGVSQGLLRTEVKGKLSDAGIPLGKADYPLLVVQVTAIKSNIGFYAYSIDLKLYDVVRRTEAPQGLEPACVWTDGDIATADMSQVGNNVKSSLDAITDSFIAEYQAENPQSIHAAPAAPKAVKKAKADPDSDF